MKIRGFSGKTQASQHAIDELWSAGRDFSRFAAIPTWNPRR
jgi:hypothetical protein